MARINIQEAKLMKPLFLEKAANKGYICPACGSGSGPHGTGIEFNAKTNKYHCWACGYTGDVIDLFGICFDIDNDREKLIKFKKYYKKHTADNNHIAPPDNTESYKKNDISQGNFKSYYEKCLKANNGKYLASRGISKPLQDRFYIGYDPEWRNPSAVDKMIHKRRNPNAIPTSPRVIIPRNADAYFARDTRAELTTQQKQYEKSNVGTVGLYGLLHADRNKPIIIVEGQIDALSVYQVGGQALALCGASNYKKVLEAAKEFPYLILMLDMDKTGRETQDALHHDLEQMSIDCECLSYAFHDPNEYLQEEVSGFLNLILDKMNG